MTDPLWLQLRNHPSLFCLHPTPKQLATMLECIASEVERRGDIDYDRDPGETAEWLCAEAARAERGEPSTLVRTSKPTMPNAICPQCRGRRVIFNPIALGLTIALPIALLVESDSDFGVTKKACPTCNGNGYLSLPSSKGDQ